MTQDEIIEMARFAGITIDSFGFQGGFIEEFVAFANLVAAKEREALAQPEQEPVAYIDMMEWPPIRWPNGMTRADVAAFDGQGLFFAPPQRTWVGLTDEEMLEAIKPLYANPFLAHNALEVSRDEYQAIEAKLKEKNT